MCLCFYKYILYFFFFFPIPQSLSKENKKTHIFNGFRYPPFIAQSNRQKQQMILAVSDPFPLP